MAAEPPHLDVDSHVVIQLGAELVTDAEQALLELVKNAYDGDATRCTISIEPDWRPDAVHPWYDHLTKRITPETRIGRIVVEDNGEGLTEIAVSKGWLRISASLKRSQADLKTKTARGRTPVGDKGLGRLATMRLGDVLYLITKVRGETRARTVSFAWSAFYAGSALHDIPVFTGTESGLRGRDKGTNVEILQLQEPAYWDSEQNIKGVVAKLSSLISPFKRIQDFNVNVRYNEQIKDLQALGAEALNHASAKFTFDYREKTLSYKAWFAKTLFRGRSGEEKRRTYEELLEDTNLPKVIKFISEDRRIKEQNFSDLSQEPGGWLFSLENKISWDALPSDPKLPGATDPGPFHGEIHYVLFNEPTRQALQAAGIAVEVLQNMTTVGMFRDGFRVRMDDDWLQLSRGVTSGGFFQLRPRNVIGYFEISNEHNPKLLEKSDREAFVDNEQWRGFMLLAERSKKFANDALESVRGSFDAYKKLHASPQTESSDTNTNADPEAHAKDLRARKKKASSSLNTARAKSATIASAITALKTSIGHEAKGDSSALRKIREEFSALAQAFVEFKGVLEEATNLIESGFGVAEQVALTNEELTNQNLRLIDAAAVGLSARGLSHELNSHLALIDKGIAHIRRFNRSRPESKLDDAIERISGATRELRKAVSSINPLLSGSRSLKDNFYIGDAVREFLEMRAGRIAELRISVEVVGGKGPRIRFAKARFNQILENLFQNSSYWVTEHEEKNRNVRRTITIDVDRNGFSWWDGGKGIRNEIENSLFDPYVTDKPESRGQGLGLFIVTAFMEAERCHITLMQDRNQWGRRYKFKADFRGALTQ